MSLVKFKAECIKFLIVVAWSLRTMARALMVWMDMHPEDFAEPPHYLTLNQILDFSIQFLPGSVLEIRTRHRLERCQREFTKCRDSILLDEGLNKLLKYIDFFLKKSPKNNHTIIVS